MSLYKEVLKKSLDVLMDGGILLYPTETLWGLGCDATNPRAIEKIKELKQRPQHKSFIVLIESVKHLKDLAPNLTAQAFESINNADRPTTLVLADVLGLAPQLYAQDGSLAVRVTSHLFCKELIKALGRPIVSSSANLSGKSTPFIFSEIHKDICHSVDYIVPLDLQGSPTGKASRIIKLMDGGGMQVIRA